MKKLVKWLNAQVTRQERGLCDMCRNNPQMRWGDKQEHIYNVRRRAFRWTLCVLRCFGGDW